MLAIRLSTDVTLLSNLCRLLRGGGGEAAVGRKPGKLREQPTSPQKTLSGFGDSGVIELRTFWDFEADDDARDICWTR